LGIEGKKLLSLNAHATDRTLAMAVEVLSGGEDVALVTDAGMPSISDPGTELVRGARAAGIEIEVLPGPSAVTAAVALSGLIDGPFTFLGFLPRKGAKRKEALSRVARSPVPVVLFESPHRMKETLRDFSTVCESLRQVAICRELTKKFEETLVHSIAELSADDFREEWLGEFTLVVDRAPADSQGEKTEEFDFVGRTAELLQSGASLKDVTAILVRELQKRGEKASRRAVYQRVLALHTAAKQTSGKDE
jgi:16S rRNA (cytidine1402-2'-O)-methyltransferase